MGYCPRCGEHSPFREPITEEVEQLKIRITVSSPIVNLPPDLPEGSAISYAGCEFLVRRGHDYYELQLQRAGRS